MIHAKMTRCTLARKNGVRQVFLTIHANIRQRAVVAKSSVCQVCLTIHAKMTRCTLVVCMIIIVFAGCQQSDDRQYFTDFSLGTVITITLYSGNRNANAQLAEHLFAYARDAEVQMSTSEEDYDDSELLRVNNAAGIHPSVVSPRTFAVVAEGIRLSQLTNGDFEVAIWPLTRLWNFARLSDTQELPIPHHIHNAIPLLKHTDIVLDNTASTIFLTRKGMGIDVGGIAKGWVGDYFRSYLQDNGVDAALIDIGGNIITVGTREDGEQWKIGIQDPHAEQGTIAGVLSLEGGTVVTSGNYERYVDIDGVRYHHIIDPRSGFPVDNGLSSVTVVTQNSAYADALSTALYVQGVEKGYEFVNSLADTEAIFITSDNQIILTPALRDSFTLRSNAFLIR